MQVESIQSDQAVVITVTGRLDTTTASDFETNCFELISSKAHNGIVIDLQALEYMSSAGLRSILSLGKKVKAQGKGLVFCSLQGMVKEVFDVSGFTSIFSVYESQEEALGAM
ncbi:MAG: STAS domain-containing protein [Desulfovermiculus sp.]